MGVFVAAGAALIGYLSDRETQVDFLNNEAIAATIVDLLRDPSGRPMTIGVHGDWGAGKSTVLEMVDAALKGDEFKGKILCLRFNGWQFQGFEDAKIALIEAIVDGLAKNQTLMGKAKKHLDELRKSIDWMKVAKKGGPLALAALTGQPALGLDQIFDVVTDKVTGLFQDKDEREEALRQLEEVKKEKEEGRANSKNISNEIAEFRTRFRELVKETKLDRLVVLVDDLDRCLPKTAIETLEAIRLFVLMEKTAFVIAADDRMIEYAVTEHFPDLPDGKDGQGYARAYLEKLIQVPLPVPTLGETETRIYVTLLLLGAGLEDDQARFNGLLELARESHSRPWEGKSFDDADLKRVLGDKYDALHGQLVLAEQISPLLSAGTKGNPRQIKRFLNALALRLAVSKARRFGDAITQAALAKLMLAEMFFEGTFFSDVARASANSIDGKCTALAVLEGVALGRLSLKEPMPADDEEKAEQADKGPPIPEDVKLTVGNWVMKPEIVRWARVPPELGLTSLKPYLFVIKDKKNYLGEAAPLTSKQTALLTKLSGGQASAAAAQQEVKQLSTDDVSTIFGALRQTVLASTSFEQKPQSMYGLESMAQAIPALEDQYLDVLHALPAKHLGAWAAVGHDATVKSVKGRLRLGTLVDHWRKTGSDALKRALARSDRAPAPRKSR